MGQHGKLYKTHTWKALRNRQLSHNPLCAFCLEEGLTTAATIVDHVERHNGDREAFFNGDLQSLCKPHHDGTKQRIEIHGYDPRVGDDGFPMDASHPFNAKASSEAADAREFFREYAIRNTQTRVRIAADATVTAPGVGSKPSADDQGTGGGHSRALTHFYHVKGL